MNSFNTNSDKFKNILLEKIMEILATDESGNKNELLFFLLTNADNLENDFKQYQDDYSKYKTGVFLWFQEEYTNLLDFLNLFIKSEFLAQISVLSGMKEATDEYYNFTEKVQIQQPILFMEELNDSKALYFEKTIRPIKILSKKNALIDLATNEALANFNDIFPSVNENLQKNIKKFSEYFNSYIKEVQPSIAKNLEVMSKKLMKQISKEQYQQLLDEEQKKIEKIKLKFEIKIQKFMEEIKNQKEENKDKKNIYLKKMEDLKILLLKAYISDPSKIIYDYITLLKDIDSYNIQFTKFLQRLYSILIYGNRDYKNNVNCYYLVKPRKYDNQTRNKLKVFLKKELSTLCPKLSNFLLNCFNYNQFRRLEAHEIPDKIKISKDGKYALIPQTGSNPDLKMNIGETIKIINTFCFFIDSLGVH